MGWRKRKKSEEETGDGDRETETENASTFCNFSYCWLWPHYTILGSSHGALLPNPAIPWFSKSVSFHFFDVKFGLDFLSCFEIPCFVPPLALRVGFCNLNFFMPAIYKYHLKHLCCHTIKVVCLSEEIWFTLCQLDDPSVRKSWASS